MSPAWLGRALAACLAFGAVDVLVLNLLVVPARRGASDSQGAAPAAIAAARDALTPALIALEPTSQLGAASVAASPPAIGGRAAAPFLVLEYANSAHWLDGRASQALTAALERLRSTPHITVIGHADGSGPSDLNERLSAVRAAVVARRLIEAGIERARVHVDWRGAREPRASGESKRVEIYLTEAP